MHISIFLVLLHYIGLSYAINDDDDDDDFPSSWTDNNTDPSRLAPVPCIVTVNTGESLHDVTRPILIVRLIYAAPAWWGFFTLAER